MNLNEPWPWYVAGPIIGITVPILLFIGNKRLGISSSLRHICAACIPSSAIPLFNYNWRRETWNLLFVLGILIGGFLGGVVFRNEKPVDINDKTSAYLLPLGVDSTKSELLPDEIFTWESVLTLRGFVMIVIGGFLVGFGTRYAQGCTSGHGIMGLASLQWPSLIATICFFIGGMIVSRFVLPYILQL
jgi:uncharacterized protein